MPGLMVLVGGELDPAPCMLAGLQLLAALKELETLSVSCTEPITDAGVAHLSQLTRLSELVLQSDQAQPKVREGSVP